MLLLLLQRLLKKRLLLRAAQYRPLQHLRELRRARRRSHQAASCRRRPESSECGSSSSCGKALPVRLQAAARKWRELEARRELLLRREKTLLLLLLLELLKGGNRGQVDHICCRCCRLQLLLLLQRAEK